MTGKKLIFFLIQTLLILPLFSQGIKGVSYYDIINQEKEPGHDPTKLIIYRPENNGDLNTVRCWVKLEDAETGEDVTYKNATATYEWVSIPDVINHYQKTYYLSGGMAMHLQLKPGKYNITVYTPKDKTNLFTCDNKEDWLSNTFFYNTDNPTKVIFISPTANENGFYNGGWHIDYKAPQFFKFTKSWMN